MDYKLLKKNDVSKSLGISCVTIDRLRRSGKLPYRKIGKMVRFLEQDIESFIINSKATEWQSYSIKGGKK